MKPAMAVPRRPILTLSRLFFPLLWYKRGWTVHVGAGGGLAKWITRSKSILDVPMAAIGNGISRTIVFKHVPILCSETPIKVR